MRILLRSFHQNGGDLDERLLINWKIAKKIMVSFR